MTQQIIATFLASFISFFVGYSYSNYRHKKMLKKAGTELKAMFDKHNNEKGQ